MRKLSIVLLAVLLVASLIISCDNSTKALTDELVEVRIGTDSGSRGLEAAIDLNDLNDTSFTWYYSARKVTEQDFNFGETDEAGVLLPPTKIVAFSQGKWNFGLWAVKDGKKVYSGTATEVLITKNSDGTPTPVVIPVSPYTGDNGFIELSDVTIHAKTGPNSFKLVTPNYACIDGEEVTNFTGSLAKTEYGTGPHVIEVAYKGNDGVTYASETIHLTVYSGRTTNISGFVNEETGSAIITPESTVEIQGFEAVKTQSTEVAVTVTPSMAEDKTTVVTFPANSFTNEAAASAVLTVNVKPIDSNFSVGAAGSSTAAAGIDISLLVNNQPVTDFNKQNVKIETYIEKGLSGVKVYYNGDIHDENPNYDPSSGKLIFNTTHFSEFYVGADTQAKIGDASYCLLTTAFDASKSGDTITLYRDVSVDSQIIVKGKTITLDLNGWSITVGNTVNLSSGIILVDNDGYLTINDTSAEETGTIDVTTDRKWVNNKGVETDYPAVWADIVIYPDNGNKAGLTINGGNFVAPFYPISGNGYDTAEDSTTITINGGTFSSTDGLCIYHPQNGTLTINGGTFEGQESAIEIRSGNLNIAGGYFKASNTPTSTNPNGSGTTTDGSAIAVAQHTTRLPINVAISGGTFEGYSAFYHSYPQANYDSDAISLSITGGIFKAINGGSAAVFSADKSGFISGGKFSSVPSSYVADGYSTREVDNLFEVVQAEAKIGDNYYPTIYDAIEAAKDGDKVTLTKDVSLHATLGINKDITLDLGEYTIYSDSPENGWEEAVQINGDGVNPTNVTVNATTGGIDAKGTNGACFLLININDKPINLTINGGTYKSKDYEFINVYGMGLSVDETGKVVGYNIPTSGMEINVLNLSSYAGDRGINSSNKNVNIYINNSSITAEGYSALYIGGGSVCTLENSTVNCEDRGILAKSSYIYPDGNIGGQVYITSGNYIAKSTSPSWLLQKDDGCILSVTGGTFNCNPTAYVDTAKYNVTNNGSTWTVTAKN